MNPELGKKVETEQLECMRCNHKWWPRLDEEGISGTPKNCSACKSPYWNKPVERKTVSESRKKK